MNETTSGSSSLPLKWHGGKHYLANWIIGKFPQHKHYVEAFFGSGAVLFAKPWELVNDHSEVVNDLNGNLANFWRTLRDAEHFSAFVRQVEATPFSKETWQESKELNSNQIDRAVKFFVRYRQSRQGLGRDFATLSRNRTRRGMNEQVSSWLSAIEGLPSAHERLKRVVIYNENAIDTIEREDGVHSFFYLDPPYLPETRTVKNCYEHEMPVEEHIRLLDTLTSIKGKFLLSGYPNDLYRLVAKRNGWNHTEMAIDNKSSGSKIKPKKIECLWSNY